MRRIRGFTLLEIMLVLLLLGVTSGLVMLSFPADEKALARQGERLNHWLNALAERAEREGVSYGVAFGSGGWRSVAAAGQASREAYALPDGIALWLSVEGQTVALDDAAARPPQVWLYPGGETTAFSVALSQGRCLWRLQAPGYFVFETTDIRCDDAENETPAGHDAAGSDGGLDDLRHRLPGADQQHRRPGA
ncbi:TPA: prepilin-type N-terminal cleavage/methylation domain-containing protein [Serratia marcescens]|jgi:general secretion pathway protein H|uniref:prepilin-type N-terminal cleavage/methylation domain-containing protein n=1 Tax=Serratia TaxID=613 RepID=UPI000B61C177|nr:prepilin-type N-terminal cleavage/methylation domain-containing protein [Serratia marcescens]ASL86449.1 type II secretion system protein GspH [Serratia marcescens]MBH2842232.1 prepilin-type N-terminal cleavage/methylation domain-containing protein [Serratia marcescens]MBH2862208.1 prepilin-type N-terminal cleavage/methylation domain-containing protein [Serratia marcescens]MBH3256531.1 prepilin-type N-terminal cleavage/methylation domain-containing protein [Serratia marcescens]MBH3334621.1 p